MSLGIETVEIFKALKAHYIANSLDDSLPGGMYAGEIQGRKQRPYISVSPLTESSHMDTAKGKYSLVTFEVGLVHNTFEEAGGPLAKLISDLTTNADLTLGTGNRLLKMERMDRRFEEIENYWVYWQQFECIVAN